MITVQDIKEKTFEKAVFGGYDMAAVDNFLDELANDIALMQRENAVLKGKMKVLAQKIEEYRGSEDALRMAILSAQKMGCMIEKEAQEKSDKIMADALAEAAKLTEKAKLELELENARLAEAKARTAKFIENMNLICRNQAEFLAKLSSLDFVKEAQAAKPAAPAPEKSEKSIHETVKSIEETVAKAAEAPVMKIRPDVAAAAAAAEEEPTRAFTAVSQEDILDDSTLQFSFDSLG